MIQLPVSMLNYVWHGPRHLCEGSDRQLAESRSLEAALKTEDGRASLSDEIVALYESVRDRGIINPLVVKQDGDTIRVITGNQRLSVAIALGLEMVPVVTAPNDDDWSDSTKPTEDYVDIDREVEIGKYAAAYGAESYGMSGVRLNAASRLLEDRRGRSSILDVGCGRGEAMELAIQAGYTEVSGAEVVDFLADREGVTLIRGIHDLPWPDDSFDDVCCFDVLEHVPEIDSIAGLREMVRIARSRVFLTVAWFPSRWLLPTGQKVDMHINCHESEWWETHLYAIEKVRMVKMRDPWRNETAAFEVVVSDL